MTHKTGSLAAQAVLTDPANIELFVLIRQDSGDRDNTGVYDPGFGNNEELLGSVQQLDGKSRAQLPEGERLLDAIIILHKTTDHDLVAPLRIGELQTDSDTIVWNNLNWAVRAVNDFASYGHMDIIATRIEGQNG